MAPDIQRYKAVFFDLDGTLIDHFSVIHRSINYATSEMGLEPVPYEKVRRTVGGSILVTFARLIPGIQVERAVELFRSEFDRIWHEDIRVLKGARSIVRALRAAGVKTAVFTNKEGNRSRQIIRHLGMQADFDAVIGTLDTPHHKPERAFSEYALAQLGVSAQHACMIGDSPFDVQAAHVVGMPCYVVATGSHSLDALRNESDCDAAYPDLIALAQAVFGLDLTTATAPSAPQ